MSDSYLNDDLSKVHTSDLQLHPSLPPSPPLPGIFDGYLTMDARNRATLSTNPPFRHPATPADARGKTKIGTPKHPRSAVSADQPLFNRYHYILGDTKQGHGVHGPMSHLARTSSQATIDASPALKKWIGEGESDNDHESDNETASTTSGSRSSATTIASSRYGPSPHPKPVTRGAGRSSVPWEAEALYGPFSRSNDFASYVEPSALPQELTRDVEMEDPGDKFNDEVMIHYRAALSSSGFDPDSDITPSTFNNSHMLPQDSIEFDPECHVTNTEGFAEIFARMRAQEMKVEKGFRKGCSKVASKAGRKPGVASPQQSGSGRTIYSP